jgi:uncharacterized membrane protein YdjX (TVP38/TMEM64 family)
MKESLGNPDSPPDRVAAPESRSSQVVRIAIFVLIVAGLTALILVYAPHLSRARVHEWAKGAGFWGPLLLVGIQAGQILLAPIPGVFVPVVAGILYGPVVGPLVTVVGTILGSAGAYWIGRTGGRHVTEKLLGRAAVAKAGSLLQGRRWIALIPIFLFPFSPADALCFVAGIVEMRWSRFMIAVAIGRVPKDALLAAAAGLGWKAFGL